MVHTVTPPASLLLLFVTIASSVAGTRHVAPSGQGCAAAAQQHRWVALAWDVTCECTDPRWPKQSNGSYCIYWEPTAPCVKYPTCGTAPSDVTCETFDNVWKMPEILGVSWLSPFGDKSNVSAPLVAAAVNKQPVGARALLLHDVDQGIAHDTGDRVLLPPSTADCGDPYTANMPYDPPTPQPIDAPSFAGIWWDEAVLKRRTQSLEFFGALKAAGGQLDDLVQDSEESSWGMQVPQPTPASVNNATVQRCMRARWTAIQNDVRFRNILPALTTLGFTANFSAPEWLADELLPFSTSPTTYMDQAHDMQKVRWNALMLTRMSSYWETAFGAPAKAYFPQLRASNFGLYGTSPQHCGLPADSEGFLACRAGSGSTGLNVHAPAIYNEVTCWTAHGSKPDPGCGMKHAAPGVDVTMHELFGVPFDSPAMQRDGFNFMVLHCGSMRGMVLAHPEMVLRPWPAFKSFSARVWDFLPDTGPVDCEPSVFHSILVASSRRACVSPTTEAVTMHCRNNRIPSDYQEEIFHAAITGADRFFFFNPTSFVYGVRAVMSDHKLLSDCLHELDEVMGCASRQWIKDDNVNVRASPASFFLSGSVLGTSTDPEQTAIWRFTPRLPPALDGAPKSHTIVRTMAKTEAGGLTIGPVEHDGESCSLQFDGGALVTSVSDPSSTMAPYGLWISQSNASASVVLSCGATSMGWPVPALNWDNLASRKLGY